MNRSNKNPLIRLLIVLIIVALVRMLDIPTNTFAPTDISDYPYHENISYEVDEQGRTIKAIAHLNYEMRQHGKNTQRPDISSIKPPGWTKNPKVTVTFPSGKIYNGYFWNRSHIIAHSLGATGIDPQNFITGTRAQNVGDNTNPYGMAYTETIARDFLDKNPTESILYEVLIEYRKGETIPRSTTVTMDFSDDTPDITLVIKNTMPGFKIDYKTGEITPTNNP